MAKQPSCIGESTFKLRYSQTNGQARLYLNLAAANVLVLTHDITVTKQDLNSNSVKL